ncbi:hypothetical protein CDAR_172451 [Caerostris darwini]|uniref:Uncharacterized protein n=1 Tax=Caerostris darwini TaxID=1538125 RepID=A0AAV4MEH0_9ARAC|nr:hypothetical protein CDAR_172451 [Caerostris darwini]
MNRTASSAQVLGFQHILILDLICSPMQQRDIIVSSVAHTGCFPPATEGRYSKHFLLRLPLTLTWADSFQSNLESVNSTLMSRNRWGQTALCISIRVVHLKLWYEK